MAPKRGRVDSDDEWIKQVPRRSNAAATRIRGQPVPKAHWGANTGTQSEPGDHWSPRSSKTQRTIFGYGLYDTSESNAPSSLRTT
ncbi:hypothetical protein DFP72DRAFT_1069987 [Ephemerocybe angulata]|uniref:Uncharacterized protein n=1 Tax=Ephemerocybe angulata TaxID=980116 RepID=A0A8H6HU13_9AGAR|nr:hypothetical protein DFP72DRAFT_1069987 [Tulosesus angulatus]